MRAYINAQNPKTISAVIHHSMLAHKIFTTKEEKKTVDKNSKAPEKNEKGKKNQSGKKVGDPKKKEKSFVGKNAAIYSSIRPLLSNNHGTPTWRPPG